MITIDELSDNFIVSMSTLSMKKLFVKNCKNLEIFEIMKKAVPSATIEEKENGVIFNPGTIIGGEILLEGNALKYLPYLLIILPFAKKGSTVNIEGITNNTDCYSIDVINHVFIKAMKDFGVKMEVEIKKRGFYPGGEGEIVIKIDTVKKLQNITKFEEKLFKFRGYIVTSRISASIPHEITEHSHMELKSLCPSVTITKDINGGKNCGPSPGYQFLLLTEGNRTIYFSEAPSSPKISPKKISERVIEEMYKSIYIAGSYDYKINNFILLLLALTPEAKNTIQIKYTKEVRDYLKILRLFFVFEYKKEKNSFIFMSKGYENINLVIH